MKSNDKLNEKLFLEYVGEKYEKIKNKKFSIPSLFFSWLYIAYRKFYSLLIVYVILERIYSAMLSSVLKEKPILVICLFIPNIILALVFNKLYLNNVKKKVSEIRNSNPEASESELSSICSKKGGVSIVSLILAVVVVVFINAVINVVLGNL